MLPEACFRKKKKKRKEEERKKKKHYSQIYKKKIRAQISIKTAKISDAK